MTPAELEERIRRAMSTKTMSPGSQLWEGVTARRRNGEDPDLLPQIGQSRVTRWVVLGCATAAALLIVTPLWQRLESPARASSTAHQPPAAIDNNPFVPSQLFAQATTSTPRFAPLKLSSTRGLRPGSWTHGLMREGEVRATYTFSLERSSYADVPAWLVISTTKVAPTRWSGLDSLWASRDGMAPLFRVSHTDSIRTERTYRDSSMLVGTTVNGYTAWKTAPLVDPLMSGAGPLYTLLQMPDIAIRLRAASLSADWTGSIPIPGRWADGRVETFWFNLVVDGTEEITTPAGRFDCWRIKVVSPSTRPDSDPKSRPPILYYFVSRDQQWLVRIGILDAPPQIDAIQLLDGREE